MITPLTRLFPQLLLLAMMTVAPLLSATPVTLSEHGKAKAVLLILKGDPLTDPPGGTRELGFSVKGAADELAACFQKMSKATFPVHQVSRDELPKKVEEARSEGKVPVLLGTLALEALGQPDEEQQRALDDPSGFVLRIQPEGILIAGRTSASVNYGVYSLLESLGVRWFFPGERGTVIPEQPTFSLPSGDLAERPSLPARHYQLRNSDDWIRHQRAGGLYFPSAHGIPLGRDASLETHPHLYALVKGERTARQLCLSHPETLARAVAGVRAFFKKNPDLPWFGLGPNDGSGFCECANCVAWDGGDWDSFSAGPSVTDRYLEFFNRILAEIQTDLPDKQLAFYIYHNYMKPPVRVKPDIRIAGAMAPISLCRIHGMNNPICPERGYLKTLIDEWKKVLPNLYERGYWYNLADPGMPFIQMHRLRDEIPYYAAQGVKGYRTECMGHWALQGPSLYIAGKLMWNAASDVDALVKDFCEKLFGPAAPPMEAYFTELDRRMGHGDHHTGSAYNLLQFYPAEVREAAAQQIADAQKLATQSPWKERVAVFADGFAYFKAFAEMFEAEIRNDWVAAHQQVLEMDRYLKRLTQEGDHPMLAEASATAHFKRFFRPAVEQGHARVTDGNRMVTPLSNQWEFLQDPQGIGETLHYHRSATIGGNWGTISAVVPWSDQGLRYYKGLAWYRQRVEIPEASAGKRIFLWMSSVDESARIWVNGKLIGTSAPSAFTPFEVDATEALKAGSNDLVICVANLRVNELGTGGIVGPGFFYAPALGEKAQLENLKPLRETFP